MPDLSVPWPDAHQDTLTGTGPSYWEFMDVSGIDACRRGWVAVSLTDGVVTDVRVAAALTSLLADDPGRGEITGIDMPLGLLETGWRLADRLAAGLLGPRRSSVFPIPPRPVWLQEGYAAANQLCRDLTSRGFSAQAWGLRAKLLEADECRERSERGDQRLYEVHPELAFSAMAGAPLLGSKHTPEGRERRRKLLAEQGIVIPAGSTAPLADVLDAAAVAWSAHRIATGSAVVIPDPPQLDDRGREITIRY